MLKGEPFDFPLKKEGGDKTNKIKSEKIFFLKNL